MSKTMSFAHLIGLATGAARGRNAKGGNTGKRAAADADDLGDQQNAKGAAEDDEDPDAEDDEDESDTKAKGRKAKKAKGEDDDEDPDAEDDEDDTKAKGRKAKKAKGEDDDEDPDAEDDDDAPKAVRADRQRCARIMAHGLKYGCAEQAGVLAFDSSMGASAAINVLKAGGGSPQGSKQPLGQRMQALGVAQVGPEGSSDIPAGMSTIAAGIIKAGQAKTGQ